MQNQNQHDQLSSSSSTVDSHVIDIRGPTVQDLQKMILPLIQEVESVAQKAKQVKQNLNYPRQQKQSVY